MSTCASCGAKLGLLNRVSGRQLCPDCVARESKRREEADRALLRNVQRGVLPSSASSQHVMNLRAGEVVHYSVEGATLMKVSRSYKRTYGGVSIPLGKSGVRTYIGQSSGRVVTTGVEPGDRGTFVVTSQRCLFTGGVSTEWLDYKQILDVKLFRDGLQFHRHTHKTPIIVKLGSATELTATILDVAVQKRLGTWVSREPLSRVQAQTQPETPPELEARRQAVREAYETLKNTFLAVVPPEVVQGLAEDLTPEQMVAQEAMRIGVSMAHVDSMDEHEAEAMADLYETLFPDTERQAALRIVRGDRFKEVFTKTALDGSVLMLGSIAARDVSQNTSGSRDVAYSALEFARSLCAVDDHLGPEELEAISRFEDALRERLAKAGVAWVAEEDGSEKEVAMQEAPQRSPEAVLAEIEALVGLDTLKQEVRDMVNFLRVQQMRLDQGLTVGSFSHHLIFAGGPGTGKTTVARLIGELYAALGVVPEGHLVEVTRAELVAGYAGQTAIKTADVVRRAIGGILFIDEAYSLDQGAQDNFGREAVDTLVKLMEDHRQELVVVTAGYTERMDSFVRQNPGLESRFKRTLIFQDYSPAELVDIFKAISLREGYELDDAVPSRVESVVRSSPDDAKSGNARFVRRLFEGAVVNQANRLADVSSPTKDELVRIKVEDVAVVERFEPRIEDSLPKMQTASSSAIELNVAGRVVPDAHDAVLEYVKRHHGTVVAYDLADRGDPDVLCLEDVIRTRIIASRISNEEAEWFVQTGIDAPWASVAEDFDLSRADALGSDVYDAMDALYGHFYAQRPKSVSVGKIHKVLHVKRPSLYPILDSRLRQLYRPAAREAARQLATRSERWKGIREHYWEAIRLDLISNEEALQNLRSELRNSGEPGSLAVGLTNLRLLDLVTWPLSP